MEELNRHKSESFLHSERIVILALILAVSYWIAEAVLDALVFGNGQFLEQLLPSEANEFWMRSLTTVLIIAIGLYARAAVGRLQSARGQLLEYRDHLERLVGGRTAELSEANAQLREDIEIRLKLEAELAQHQDHLEELLEQRAGELKASNLKLQEEIAERKEGERELRIAGQIMEAKHTALREKNLALKTVLNQVDNEKNELKSQIQTNVERVIMPTLRLLKKRADATTASCVDLLDANLRDIASPLANRLESDYARLSPGEIEVCNMIQNGLSSKEIAGIRGVSVQTISMQRKRIRRKLDIANRNVSLPSLLKSLTVRPIKS